MKFKLLLLLFFSGLVYLNAQTSVKSEYLFTSGSLNNSGTNTNALNQNGSALTTVTGIENTPNGAISLNGDDLSAPSYVSTGFYEYSISFWIKTTDVSSTPKDIINHNDAGVFNGGWIFTLENGHLNAWMRFYDPGRQTWDQESPITFTHNNIADGDWHHIVLTIDTSTAATGGSFSMGITNYRLYIDTNQVLNQTMQRLAVGAPQPVPNNVLEIGTNYTAATNSYTGEIDNIRYYHGLLTNSDILALYSELFNPNQLTRAYVDINATGANDGSSWADAYTDLQDGIDEAVFSSDKTVWVAAGTYKPGNTRSSRFNIPANGLKLFGGFDGTETQRDQRNPRANPTVISGDLNDNDDPNDISYNSSSRSDNAYKVFYVNANDVEINGFTIKGGHANQTSNNFNNRGAAIYKEPTASNFTIKHCIITENVANREGTLNLGHTVNSNVLIESCEFSNNLGRYGAGFSANQNSGNATLNIVVNNSLFYNNVSEDIAGASALNGSSLGIFLNNGGQANVTIKNNTFSNNYDLGTNTSFDKGTAILRRYTSSDVLNAEVHNNVFWNNFSDNSAAVNNQDIGIANGLSITLLNFTHNNSIQTNLASKASTFTESNNLSTDPFFIDEANNDYGLQASSPMIDVGDNSQVLSGITEDILGNNRFENTTVDLGAFEFNGPPPDVTAPTVNTQDITVQLDVNGQVSIQASDVDNGSTDDQTLTADLILSLDQTTFDCSNIGQNTVTLTAEDEAGNTATDTVIVTVEDTTAPNAITQDITVQLDANGQASILPSDIDDGSTDNCNVNSLSLDITSFDCSSIGQNTVTLTVEDDEGNATTESAVVTVEDVNAPTVIGQDITVAIGPNGIANFAPSELDNGSFDNCGINLTATDVGSFDCTELGVNQVELFMNDDSFNLSSVFVNVTVIDNLAPNILTQDIIVQLDANGQASITVADIDNGTTDNCTVSNLSLDITSFDCSNIGQNTVTLTAEDASSNLSQAVATVTVVDAIAPNLITQDITVQLDANGQASIQASDITNGSNDNCSIANFVISEDTFDCSNLGVNTITVFAEDFESNTSQGTAVVTVEDNLAPSLTNQDITIDLAGNNSISIVPSDVLDQVSDNCTANTNINLSLDQDTFTSDGVYTVNLTAEDAQGNTVTVQAEVTVDNTLGIDEQNFAEVVKLYPNPATSTVKIESKTTIDTVEIFDQLGRQVLTTNSTTFNIQDLPSGLYFVKIKSAKNQVIKRLIKS
jgi:hypothetical protein